MPQRKPRSRKAAAAGSRAPAARGRIGPLWWGAGLLALGWIAFDANRSWAERHMPEIADLRLPWEAAAPAPPRREAARRPPPAAAPARPPAERPTARPEHPVEARAAALRPAAPPEPAKPVIPLSAPRRGEPAAAAAPAAPAPAVPATGRALAAAGSSFTTRGPTPLRRAPRAGAPVWMVLDAGRPLRVTRREGGFARVESGIFTGWVEAAVVPEAPARAAPPRTAAMPTLAAADARRISPVPSASVPAPLR